MLPEGDHLFREKLGSVGAYQVNTEGGMPDGAGMETQPSPKSAAVHSSAAPSSPANPATEPGALKLALGPEAEPAAPIDPLSLMAVDANALAGAIWSGQGTDVGKLIENLLRDRPAA